MSVWSPTVFPGRKIIAYSAEQRTTPTPGTRIQIVNPEWAETDWTLARATRTHQFWMLCAMMAAMGTGAGMIMHHLVAMAMDVGHTAALAAFIFSLAGLCSIGGRLGGFLSDRWGREIVFTILAFFLYPEFPLSLLTYDPERGGLASLSLRPGLRLGAGLSSPTFGAGPPIFSSAEVSGPSSDSSTSATESARGSGPGPGGRFSTKQEVTLWPCLRQSPSSPPCVCFSGYLLQERSGGWLNHKKEISGSRA